jgi:hypothetical protein
MIYKSIFLVAFISLSVASITLKAKGVTSMITPSNERQITLLTSYLEVRNINATEKFNLNQEGSFIAYVYRQKSCDGGWLITPMERNSEGVDLFTRQAIYKEYQVSDVAYLLQGNVHHSFPNRGLWIAQKVNGVKRALGFNTYRIATVFAFRAFGECPGTLFEKTV